MEISSYLKASTENLLIFDIYNYTVSSSDYIVYHDQDEERNLAQCEIWKINI